MVEKAVSTFGRLDGAFENAGIQSPAVETADVTGDVFDRIDRINLRGVWSCMKYERLQMRTQKSGAIVNCSSLDGFANQHVGRNAPAASRPRQLALEVGREIHFHKGQCTVRAWRV